MGNDHINGGGTNSLRYDNGQGKRLCRSFFAVTEHFNATACNQRRRDRHKLAHNIKKALPSYGVRFKMELVGAYMGLSLSWIEI